jgi:carbonic anhydrase/acetyltransferase-like protein (isoleucine patch superfamily)
MSEGLRVPPWPGDALASEVVAADDAFVARGATVLGAVTLGAAASVWFGAVLRGDTMPITVGARSNIQDGSVLHGDAGEPLTIGDGCTIGHGVVLHSCTIEDGALIGMGATVLNGARIGARCIVGAGALVTSGKAFPPEHLVLGSPAKAVRPLRPDEIADLAVSAQHYVDAGAQYAAAGWGLPHAGKVDAS